MKEGRDRRVELETPRRLRSQRRNKQGRALALGGPKIQYYVQFVSV